MSILKFKEALVRLISHRTPKDMAVLRELIEHLFPSECAEEIRKVHSEAYLVNGMTVIISKLGSQESECILVDFETGNMFCKETN